MPRVIGNGLDLRNTRVQNTGDPVAPGDAVNLQFITNFINGLRFKNPARVATTGPVTLTAPGASIDGVALSAGDRVLVKNQTDATQNGVYVWNGAAAAMTRATDADSAAELQSAVVIVAEGTSTDAATGALANGDRAWLQRVDNVTLGTTALVWIPLPGASTMYVAGDSLALSGVTFRVTAVSGGGITVTASGLQVDANIVSRHKELPAGDGVSTTVTLAHNLGRSPVPVTLMNVATKALEETDVVYPDDNTVQLTWAAAPGTNAYRASIG